MNNLNYLRNFPVPYFSQRHFKLSLNSFMEKSLHDEVNPMQFAF